MIYTQRIVLDISSVEAYRYRRAINAKQGDNQTRVIEATILVEGKKYTPPAGATATFRAVKPDGKSVINPATILETGEIRAELTEQVLAVDGIVKADISISEKGSDIISTASFIIHVEKAPLGDISPSENEFLELQQLLADGRELVDNLSKTDFRVEGDFIQFTLDGAIWKNLLDISEIGGAGGLRVKLTRIQGPRLKASYTAVEIKAAYDQGNIITAECNNSVYTLIDVKDGFVMFFRPVPSSPETSQPGFELVEVNSTGEGMLYIVDPASSGGTIIREW